MKTRLLTLALAGMMVSTCGCSLGVRSDVGKPAPVGGPKPGGCSFEPPPDLAPPAPPRASR